MSQEIAKRGTTDVAPALSKETVQVFTQMITQLPEEDGNGSENILRALLSATTLEALNAPWESSDAKKLAGKVLRFNSCIRRPSDFKGGIGEFLVCFITDTTNGEDDVYTTGSLATMAQIVRLYLLKMFPFYARVIVAERPTKEGFYPHHLEIVGVDTRPPAEPETEE